MLKKILGGFLVTIFLLNQAYAEDIKVIGSLPIKKPSIHKNEPLNLKTNLVADQYISLLKLDLSASAINNIEQRAQQTLNINNFLKNQKNNIPKQKELGMNNVPVLNQGAHGSCVVFSVTAGLDAILGKGDYVSQTCQLTLGRHIENNGHVASGWNGALNRNILSELDLFGFVSKDVESTNGCAGLTAYPISGDDSPNAMEPSEFHKYSQKLLTNNIAWSSILDVFQAGLDNLDPNRILTEVKKSLLAGDRVAIGVIILDYTKGVVGAQGTHNANNDSWVLTQEAIDNIKNQDDYVGHALLITGYDDDAQALDVSGRSHKGLLTLRNSWGNDIGDKGDFYMSYDYFKTLVIEAERLRHI